MEKQKDEHVLRDDYDALATWSGSEDKPTELFTEIPDVVSLNASAEATAADVLATHLSSADLAVRCGISEEAAASLLAVCRGEGLDQVTPNLQPKSLNACKSFSATSSPEVSLGKCNFKFTMSLVNTPKTLFDTVSFRRE